MIKVFINPGHDSSPTSNGGVVDPGAISLDRSLKECDVAFSIGMKLYDILHEAGGYQCYVLQSDNLCGEDSYSYRYSVVNQCNVNDTDYFISIHCNACASHQAEGTEVLVYSFDSQAAIMADYILESITGSLDTEDRGVRQRKDLAVLKGTQCPAVLIETEFIDGPNWEILKDKQQEFAEAIAVGFTDYIASLGD